MASERLSPYQRIVRNAQEGRGVVLSAAEVAHMSGDTAIWQLAMNDNEDDEEAPHD